MHCNGESSFLLPDTKYLEDPSFFKQMISLIDQCSKLMKDDRIFLRNKIKDHMREQRQNKPPKQHQINQIKTLTQIFAETNRKKTLTKIQKTDKLMSALQTQLRKFIDNDKKQKHRKEVESFVNWKDTSLRTANEPNKPNRPSNLSRQSVIPIYMGTIEINKNHDSHRKSLQLNLQQFSKSKENSPLAKDQKFMQCSFRKTSSFIKKQTPKYQSKPFKQIKQNELVSKKRPQQILTMEISTLPQSKNNSLQHSNSLKKPCSTPKGNKICKIQKQPCKLAKAKQKQKTVDQSKDQKKPANTTPKQITTKQPPNPLLSINSFSQNSFVNKTTRYPKNLIPSQSLSNRSNDALNDSANRYELSTKKIQQMFERTNNILHQLDNKNNPAYINPPSHRNSESIFTPPEFLAQCRNYLLGSSKKNSMVLSLERTPQREKNISRKLTFSSTLNESEWDHNTNTENLPQRQLQQSLSLRNSLNFGIKKPSQANAQLQNATIHNLEQLLLHIFQDHHTVSLNNSQLEQIMNTSVPECRNILQQYCNLLISQASNSASNKTFNFIPMARYFHTYCSVFQTSKQYFSISLNSLLDSKKKGFVNSMDFKQFFQKIERANIEPQCSTVLRINLQQAYMKCCQIQAETFMTKWSLYYLELKKDINLQTVKQLSNKIQIQGLQR